MKLLTLFITLLISAQGFSQTFNAVNKVTQTIRTSMDFFGRSTALDGDWAIAGTTWEDEDENDGATMSNAGAAYILKKENGVWIKHQKIVAPDRSAPSPVPDLFGASVDIQGDWAFVGSLKGTDEFNANNLIMAGAVYFFKRNPLDDVWSFVQKIVASDRNETGASFGYSEVDGAIAVDGNTLMIGAYLESDDENETTPISDAGAVYYYDFNGTTWDFVQKIVAPPVERFSGDRFGWVLDLHNDWLVISATRHQYDASGANPVSANGAIFIYEKVSGVWTYRQKFVDHLDRANNEGYGQSVKIEDDIIAVTCNYDDDDDTGGNYINNAGSVFLYNNVSGTWSFSQKLLAPDRAIETSGQQFGAGIGMSGNLIAVSSPGNSTNENGWDSSVSTGNSQGALFIYKRDAGAATYTNIQKVVPSDRDINESGGEYGSLCNVEMDGPNILVGANSDGRDENGNGPIFAAAGSVYFLNACLPPSNETIEVSICELDSVLIGGVFEKNSGTYYDTIITEIGCDSLYQTINLTLLSLANNSKDTVYIDEGDSAYIDGLWYDTDTTINFILPYGAGCDSAIVDTVIIINGSNPPLPPNVTIVVEIPNIFTPNGDDFNDLLVIAHESGIEMNVTIFNRWGGLEYDDVNTKPWDGKKDGSDASEGTYFVVVKGLDPEGDEFKYTGSVTLKR